MSPDAATVGLRRVIRAGVAPAVPAMTFPTIVELPKVEVPEPADHLDATDATDADDEAHEAAPQIDPEVLEQARLEAAAKGYADGYAAGQHEAISAVRSDAADVLGRLEAAIAAFETRRQQSFDELTDGVARFAFATVE